MLADKKNFKMPHIICIHVGQAGVQIGNALWELMCLEHGVSPDGCVQQRCLDSDALFAVCRSGRVIPRALMVDLEPLVIDEIRHGAYRCLFAPDLLLTGKEDAANNYARGYYSIGRRMIDVTLDGIRRIAEMSPDLQGIFIFRSFGGGTGSGFTALLLERLSADYGRKSKFLYSVYPAPKISPVIVEPYNAILTTHGCINYEDCSFLFDNEACYNILGVLGNRSPTYTNCNRLIAQVVSATTSAIRFGGPQVASVSEFQTNLLPYPRIHFPIQSYAPLVGRCRSAHQMMSSSQIAAACFQPSNQMVKCDIRNGKFLSCCLCFRGNIVSTDINHSIQQIKNDRTIRFVPWSPAGFKVSISSRPPVCVPGGDLASTSSDACMICNNTIIKDAWSQLLKKYNILLKKRAFVHHFVGEGMEEREFQEAAKNVAALIQEYIEIEKEKETRTSRKTKT